MNRLRDLREDRDMNQKEIAKIIGCSQTTYSRYETGDLNVPVDILKKLAIFFNTSIDYLIGFTNERKAYKRMKRINEK